ncbi:hypothetical protein K523DRAFT_408863 [Schizophyllum commune Tattone D]|nr:hypothetical protein K523DRAFT_408863 [Schizophyllum commune Tattone D]
MSRTSPTARSVIRDSSSSSVAATPASVSTLSSPEGSRTPSSSSVSSITSNSSVPQNTCSLRIRSGAGSPGGGGPSPSYPRPNPPKPGPNPPNPGPNPPPGMRGSDRHLNYAEMGALRALLLLDQERNGAIGTFYNPPTP